MTIRMKIADLKSRILAVVNDYNVCFDGIISSVMLYFGSIIVMLGWGYLFGEPPLVISMLPIIFMGVMFFWLFLMIRATGRWDI